MGRGLSTRQAEGGPHAPEKPAPPPTVGFRVNIDGLVQIPEVTLSLVVGKEIQQAKKVPMNAPGRGDNRGEESTTHILRRVAGPIFVNLLLCPVGEHEIPHKNGVGPLESDLSLGDPPCFLPRDCSEQNGLSVKNVIRTCSLDHFTVLCKVGATESREHHACQA